MTFQLLHAHLVLLILMRPSSCGAGALAGLQCFVQVSCLLRRCWRSRKQPSVMHA
jgi:hypothetical protein